MKGLKTLVFSLLISTLSTTLLSQQINTDYFIENNPLRQDYNPAFKPKTDYFISLPFLGNASILLGNNSITLKDAVYSANGQTILFNNPNGNIDKFYNTLQPNTFIQADLRFNIISFGWRVKKDYITFSIDQRVDRMIEVPKSIFRLALYGTPDLYDNSFDMTKLQSDFSYYTEAGVCYTKRITSELTIGGKLKILYGTANISNTNKNLKLDANIQGWSAQGDVTLNYTGSQPLNISNKIPFDKNVSMFNFLKSPSGMGAGIDLGVNLKVGENIVLSASLLDFGFISWYNKVQNTNYNIDYKYDGVKKFDIFNYDISSPTVLSDSLLNALNASYSITQTSKSYTTATKAKLNVGVEYKILNNHLSLGVLSHSDFFNQNINEEITASLNAKPTRWLNAALSYSLINGQYSALGFGLGLRTGFMHWMIGADFIPTQFVKLPVSGSSAGNIPIPYTSRKFNLSFGLNIVLNKSTKRYFHNSTGLYGHDVDEE